MAASSNDSFGLKIATAFSIALTVILLVAVYFLNSGYNLEFEKNAAAQKKIGEITRDREAFATQANDYRRHDRLSAHRRLRGRQGRHEERSMSRSTPARGPGDQQTEIATTVDEFKKKIEAKGADASQFEALKQRSRERSSRRSPSQPRPVLPRLARTVEGPDGQSGEVDHQRWPSITSTSSRPRPGQLQQRQPRRRWSRMPMPPPRPNSTPRSRRTRKNAPPWSRPPTGPGRPARGARDHEGDQHHQRA